jgi:cytochrome c oxidase assembly protein subunit 15
MVSLPVGKTTYPVSRETKWRHRFTILTAVVTVLLLAWGGVVTSIDAGMAFPDWPTSLGSYNWLNPVDRWWANPAYLAEHGHRILGSVTGLLTLTLAVWTWQTDPRAWMRWLGGVAVLLVVAQGVLGGLRVIFVSTDLAMVHACVAQLFFALLVGMALFTSEGWLQASSQLASTSRLPGLRRATLATVCALYVQIVLGALLRHQGGGTDPLYVGLHVTGACLVIGFVGVTGAIALKHLWGKALIRRGVLATAGAVALQFVLGFSAYLVLVYESAAARRSVLQVALNSAHLVVGAILMAAALSLTLLVWRPAQSLARSASNGSSSLQPASAAS